MLHDHFYLKFFELPKLFLHHLIEDYDEYFHLYANDDFRLDDDGHESARDDAHVRDDYVLVLLLYNRNLYTFLFPFVLFNILFSLTQKG